MSEDDTVPPSKEGPTHHNLVEVEGHEGLYECTVCTAVEGQLLSYCPGYELNHETKEACYQGNVSDLRI